MTLNGLMAAILRYFTEFGSFRAALRKWLKIYLNFLQHKCCTKLLVFDDIITRDDMM